MKSDFMPILKILNLHRKGKVLDGLTLSTEINQIYSMKLKDCLGVPIKTGTNHIFYLPKTS